MMATLSENTIGYNRDRRDILISIGKRRTTLKCNSRRVTERIGTKTVTTQCSELRQVYPSVHAVPITSHDRLGRVTSILEAKCVPAKHDGCQFGQVCSSIPVPAQYSQMLRKCSFQRNAYHIEVLLALANLYINHYSTNRPFNSNEANQKLSLSAVTSPISITSKEGTFSISHTE